MGRALSYNFWRRSCCAMEPNNLTILAAVAANGTIHIFNIEEKQQVLAIDPDNGYIYDLSLSATMFGILATVGESGSIVLTDFLEHDFTTGNGAIGVEFNSEFISNKFVTTTLKCVNRKNENHSKILNCVEFNDANINYIAASDMDGNIYIWRLGQQIIETQSKIRLSSSEKILIL